MTSLFHPDDALDLGDLIDFLDALDEIDIRQPSERAGLNMVMLPRSGTQARERNLSRTRRAA